MLAHGLGYYEEAIEGNQEHNDQAGPEQRAEDDGATIAGQVHNARLHDEAAEFDEMARSLTALGLPRPHVMPRPLCLMPIAGCPVAVERRQRRGQVVT